MSLSEREWLATQDPPLALGVVVGTPLCHTAGRKARLYACACARLVWSRLGEPFRSAVEKAEQAADGKCTSRALAMAHGKSLRAMNGGKGRWARAAACFATEKNPWYAGLMASSAVDDELPRTRARRRMCCLLRDIFGPLPFRTVDIASEWLTSGGGSVVHLATAIYDERMFDRMPLLADALEEAGCTNAEILDHCRRDHQEHVRGCWVVDLIREASS